MANEFPVEGDKLKKLIKKSRAMPIPFGFNPGTSDEDDEYLAAHARKAPEVLGKLAMAEGAGTKSAFGTFAVDGSEVHMTCFRTVPQLAKKFKKYLKRFKITLNCVVMDPDGNIIDSDIETLDNWEDDDSNDDDDDGDDAAAQDGNEGDDGGNDESGIDPADLANRLRALQPKVAGAAPAVRDRVAAAFKGAVGLVKDGRLSAASIAIAQLEAVMARVAAAAQSTPPMAPPPQQPSGPTAQKPPEQTPPQGNADAPDPRLPRLRQAVQQMSGQVGAALGPGAGPILDELARIDELIDAGQADVALAALRGAQEAMRAGQAAREKWDKAQAILDPQVSRALSTRGVADPDGLRTRWQFAVTLAAEGGWERALASVPGIVEKLRETAQGTAPDAPPVGVVAIQRARILWRDARLGMLAAAQGVVDEIAAQSADDEDHTEITKAGAEILAEVQAIDDRLHAVLEKLTVEPEGRGRTALKAQASALVTEYRQVLGAGIFPLLDTNPFKTAAVSGSARAALNVVADALAA